MDKRKFWLIIFVIAVFYVFALTEAHAYQYPRYDLCTVEPIVVRVVRCDYLVWIAGTSRTGWMGGTTTWVESEEQRQAIMSRIFTDAYQSNTDQVMDYVYCDQ